jgi:hypothetical protein
MQRFDSFCLDQALQVTAGDLRLPTRDPFTASVGSTQEPRARNTEESTGQASPCRIKLSSGTLRGLKDAKEVCAIGATKDFQERGRLAHCSPATPETACDNANW